MPAPAGFLPTTARLAVYAAAILVVLLARLPAPAPESVAMLRPTTETAPAPAPSPVRFVLLGVLLAGVLVETAGRRPRWR